MAGPLTDSPRKISSLLPEALDHRKNGLGRFHWVPALNQSTSANLASVSPTSMYHENTQSTQVSAKRTEKVSGQGLAIHFPALLHLPS